MKSRSKVAALSVTLSAAMLCVTLACSTDAKPEAQQSIESSAPQGAAASSVAEEESDALSIDVQISGGSVTPTNERIEAVVGETITVRIDSDVADELHVHSVPDHSFAVEAAAGQSFEFVVDVPGTVALELHDAGKTVATLLVRP
ncbi:hypothetical protein [Rhodococcus sovatensis]|uniref:EfeO-type cupredoxin-like domain-containing protein n=1 Tax=Rhodococcus sovatensis TaxID=1805840 RepID=A0ABZ2PQX5_9NOCA